MPQSDFTTQPHRRLNPLTGEWVLVSPHRTQRPWQGQVERAAVAPGISYDPSCYLCPGNPRAGGEQNPAYEGTFVFENDFAALKPAIPPAELNVQDLLVARSEAGRCRVLCYSPRHDLTLARMAASDIRRVVDAWVSEFSALAADPAICSVQIFENRGAMMGCSNPHPHGQIWANQNIPNELAKEVASQEAYFARHGRTMLEDYLSVEVDKAERIVAANGHFVLVVPYWAVWPFETMVISRRAVSSLDQLTVDERDALADILGRATVRYDNLFETSFPYTMGFHQRPTDGSAYPGFHLHAHFYPPLLRSATVKKFMVGYEMLGMPQRDIMPESAANHLRELSEVHYLAGT